MTPEERAQLLEEMRALEQEHLAVTTAAQVLKGESEALDKLLRGIIPMEEILKAIETEQRKGWKRSPGNNSRKHSGRGTNFSGTSSAILFNSALVITPKNMRG